MSQEPALDRVPAGIMLSQEEWAFFSETSRRFLVAVTARRKEMERLLAERDGVDSRTQQAGDQAATPDTRAEAADAGR